jgi:hypothetical protein
VTIPECSVGDSYSVQQIMGTGISCWTLEEQANQSLSREDDLLNKQERGSAGEQDHLLDTNGLRVICWTRAKLRVGERRNPPQAGSLSQETVAGLAL